MPLHTEPKVSVEDHIYGDLSYNKRVVERGPMSLKKLQLIEIAQDYGFQDWIRENIRV